VHQPIGAQVLFVGLGTPKQEQWMAAHKGTVGAVMLGWARRSTSSPAGSASRRRSFNASASNGCSGSSTSRGASAGGTCIAARGSWTSSPHNSSGGDSPEPHCACATAERTAPRPRRHAPGSECGITIGTHPLVRRRRRAPDRLRRTPVAGGTRSRAGERHQTAQRRAAARRSRSRRR
jgi:hypothetical protein